MGTCRTMIRPLSKLAIPLDTASLMPIGLHPGKGAAALVGLGV